VANLWDVTDKDIDRFSQAALSAWISGGGGGSSGTEGAGQGSDMSAAVAASRAACKLPHLVGAAPVCYGIPASLFFGRAH
jgi:separase